MTSPSRRTVVIGAVALVVAIAAIAGVKRYAAGVATTRVTTALTRVAAYADVDYEDVSVDLLGLVAHVWNLRITPVGTQSTVTIQDVAVSDVEGSEPLPDRLTLALRGISVEEPHVAAVDQSGLLALLLDTPAVADVEVAYRYARDTRALTVDRLEVGVRNLFTASVATSIAHFAISVPDVDVAELAGAALDPLTIAEALDEDGGSLLEALHDTALQHAELRFEDHGLLARLALVGALKTGTSPVQFIENAVKELEAYAGHAEAALTVEHRTRLKEFVTHPGMFRLAATPKVPVPVMRFLLGAATQSVPDLRVTFETSPGAELTRAAVAGVPRMCGMLETSARRALDGSRWHDAAVATQRLRTLTADDAVVYDLQQELRRRSGVEFDITRVDFSNFAYTSHACTQHFGPFGPLRNPVRVRNGEYTTAIDSVEDVTFQVREVLHGDLTGDGLADAVVVTECAMSRSTFSVGEVFVFSLRNGTPQLVASLPEQRIEADYRQAFGGSTWAGLGVRMGNGRIIVSIAADGPRAEPLYDATFQYHLGLTGLALATRPERANWKPRRPQS